MASLEKYFAERDKNKPAAKWVYGDRISGKVGKVPVMGMVIREDYEDPTSVLTHLDLPIKVEGEYRWVTYVPTKGMKRLKEIL
jgi:hypothetical protein